MGKLWAVLNDSDDLLDYIEAETDDEAIEAFARKANVPQEDVRYLYAIPGDKVRGDVWVPRWLVDALERGPEAVLGSPESAPEAWDDFWAGVSKLESRGIRIADIVAWLRVHNRDFWVAVVK